MIAPLWKRIFMMGLIGQQLCRCGCGYGVGHAQDRDASCQFQRTNEWLPMKVVPRSHYVHTYHLVVFA